MSVTQAVIASLARPRARTGGHGSYAVYLLVRWAWSKIGWWTMVPVSAIVALGAWAKSSPAPHRRRVPPRYQAGSRGRRPGGPS